MTLSLLTSPQRTVNGITSNVCAAKAQIPFTFLRADLENQTVLDGDSGGWPGTIRFAFVLGSEAGALEIGDLCYLTFPDTYQSGVYDVYKTQTLATKQVFFNIPYTAPTTASVNLLTGRPNYVVSIQITNTDDGTLILPAPLNYKPKQSGELFVDLSDIFFGFDFFVTSLNFQIDFTEQWTGDTGTSGISPPIIGAAGFKQLQQTGGTTMWENAPNEQSIVNITGIAQSGDNVAFTFTGVDPGYNVGDFATIESDRYKGTFEVLTASPTTLVLITDYLGAVTAGSGSSIGKITRPGGLFLTEARAGTVWLYYKRDISFVIDSDLLARTGSASLNLVITGRDAAGGAVFSETTPYSEPGIHTKKIPVLETAVTWTAFLTVGPSDVVGSEFFTFKQKPACVNPIMLEWLGRKGQPEQHLFSINQAVRTVSKSGLVYESPILDTYDNVQQSVGRLPLGAGQFITLTAEQLTLEQFKTLRFLKESASVALFLNVSGTKKIVVAAVEDLSTPYETNAALHSFTCLIRLPENFEIENLL